MSKYFIEDTTLTSIADAIRTKTGKTDTMSAADMATQIQGISAGDSSSGADIDAILSGDYDYTGGTGVLDSNITKVGDYALYGNEKIETLNLPNCTTIGNSSFYKVRYLREINLPNVTTIGEYSFTSTDLREINLPNVTTIGRCTFQYISNLQKINIPNCENLEGYCFEYVGRNDIYPMSPVSLPKIKILQNREFGESYIPSFLLSSNEITQIGGSGYYYSPFYNCPKLKHIIMPNVTAVPKLPSSDGLVGEKTKYKEQVTIYVPAAMVDSYKAATNWSAYNIAAIEDSKEELQGMFEELDALEGWK